MKIGITNDHRGYQKKQFLTNYLKELGYTIIDYGSDSEESVDFPDYAKKLGIAIQNNEVKLGIAICGTGIGMSITLNKIKGIYCAKVSTTSEARLARSHNNANAIALGEDVPIESILEIVDNFINTPFSNINKYIKRNDMIKEMEND